MTSHRSCKICTFNCKCKGFKPRNYSYLQNIFKNVDFLLLQELWLFDFEFDIISKVLPQCSFIAKSSMANDKLRNGRPYGGTAILWKNNSYFSVTDIETESDRLCVCKVQTPDKNFILLNVYMPTNNCVNNDFYDEILYEVFQF